MNLRFFDWIWHITGTLALSPAQSSDEAFDRLNPLFGQTGTRHERTRDTLIFTKKDPAAQDKMSVFDHGVLQIEDGVSGPVLRYRLASRALLFCFLAPLLFLGIAQLTVFLKKLDNPSTEAAGKSGNASDAAAKKSAKKAEVPMNPIDKALGAPAPEKKDKKGKDNSDDEDKKPSSTPGYVFAGIFATLYVVGRLLEARLVKTLFRRKLAL